MITLSDIDTQRFGIVIARHSAVSADSMREVLTQCRERGVSMLIARCDAADLRTAQALELAGATLMDTLVYYQRELNRPILPDDSQISVRRLMPDDVDAVSTAAKAAFKNYFGHYHADPRLARDKCDEAYVSWAERSCRDPTVASTVIVGEREGAGVIGFLTLQVRGAEEWEIILNGVHPSHQRQGAYRALLVGAIEEARAGGARLLSVSTQLTNIGVQKAWCRAGFEPRNSFYTFHVWF